MSADPVERILKDLHNREFTAQTVATMVRAQMLDRLNPEDLDTDTLDVFEQLWNKGFDPDVHVAEVQWLQEEIYALQAEIGRLENRERTWMRRVEGPETEAAAKADQFVDELAVRILEARSNLQGMVRRAREALEFKGE